MVLLEEYFELQETENVSFIWKAAQIASYILAAGFGIICGYILAVLRVTFDNKCFLYSKVHPDARGDLRIQNEQFNESIWFNSMSCDYCQYSMVSSFIFATIWAAFFLMCGKGGKSNTGLPQPWRIALPALMFNFMYFVISIVAALEIYNGINVFCETPNDFISDIRLHNCAILHLYYMAKFKTTMIHLDIAIKSAWMTTLSWLLAFVIPLIRILFVIDFKIYKVSVYGADSLNNSNEEVLSVTEFDEKRRVRFISSGGESHLHED
ncbi:UNVERIFIED_CONTAM: hypothetical protein PYX00_006969 [Menopon gallinae]|uniref:Uncharacterized protein n=1 Tax=Menopon gallinae TaxID=328185 RepID=A0AAW2HH28_9NEOP